jgi:Ubiquinol-cytochrome C reductase hinge protein
MDGEPVDPKELLENDCARKECAQLFKRLVRCTARVQSHDTTETCTQELFELTPCVDSCVARKLFSYLK